MNPWSATLFDRYRSRRLDPAFGGKPLDIGEGGLTASLQPDGRLTAANGYHPKHGYVTLTAAAPFPEEARSQPAVVRVYRAGLAAVQGFGLVLGQAVVRREAWLIEDAIPYLRLTLADGTVAEAVTFVDASGPVVVQQWRFSGPISNAHWAGRLSLQRCAYTQLTEGGPIACPPVQTRIAARHSPGSIVLRLDNPALEGSAAIRIDGLAANTWDAPAGLLAGPVELALPVDGPSLTWLIGLGPDADARLAAYPAGDAANALETALAGWRDAWQGWRFAAHPLDAALRRGLVYAHHCCVPVGDEALCMITDHQLLPLAWTRDSFYAALALLRWRPELAGLVRGHLIWLFEVAQRPGGVWGRSYLINGRLKDPAFQLDQQLYPLLELAETIDATGESDLLERFRKQVRAVLTALLARRDPASGLFPTAETPADDPVTMPFHLSSHILLWHVLRRIGPLLGDKSLPDVAEEVRQAIWRHFAAAQDGTPLLAYLTDGQGRHRFYHDANDLPLALAPLWGFCPADDPLWRATVNFAFSTRNQGGFYPGRYGGLGSVHTPAPWPLGDMQALLAAYLTGDATLRDGALARLRAAAQWDGSLPEAYDADTAAVVSRHWFAWPGAALAWMALMGALEPDSTGVGGD